MIPVRMNKVPVKIKLIAKKGRFTNNNRPGLDKSWKRPRGKKVYLPDQTIEINAQVSFDTQEDRLRTELGDSPRTIGHMDMDRKDWLALENQIQKGDKVVEIAGEDVSYEIREVKSAAYLRGRWNIKMLYFDYPHEDQGRP